MAAVQLTEARIFEMLGRVFAECHDRAQRGAVLEQQVRDIAEAYAALERQLAAASAPMATEV